MNLNKKTAVYDRVRITNALDLTIPITASLYTNGGGIFENELLLEIIIL